MRKNIMPLLGALLVATLLLVLITPMRVWADEPSFKELPLPAGVTMKDWRTEWPAQLSVTSASTYWIIESPSAGVMPNSTIAVESLMTTFSFPDKVLSLGVNLTPAQISALMKAGYTVRQCHKGKTETGTKYYRSQVPQATIQATQYVLKVAAGSGNIIYQVEDADTGQVTYYAAAQASTPGSIVNPLYLPSKSEPTMRSFTVTLELSSTASITDINTAVTTIPAGRTYWIPNDQLNGYEADLGIGRENEYPYITGSDGVGTNIPSEGLPTLILMDTIGQQELTQPLPGSISQADLNVYLSYGCTRVQSDPHGINMLDVAMDHLNDGRGGVGYSGIQSSPRAWVYAPRGCVDGSEEYNEEVTVHLIKQAFQNGALKKAVLVMPFGSYPEIFWPAGFLSALQDLQGSGFDLETIGSAGNDARLDPLVPALISTVCAAASDQQGFIYTPLSGCKGAVSALAASAFHPIEYYTSGVGFRTEIIAGTSVSAMNAGALAIWNHGIQLAKGRNMSFQQSWAQMKTFSAQAHTYPDPSATDPYWGKLVTAKAGRGDVRDWGHFSVQTQFPGGTKVSGVKVWNDAGLTGTTDGSGNLDLRPALLAGNLHIKFLDFNTGTIWEGSLGIDRSWDNTSNVITLIKTGTFVVKKIYLPLIEK